MTTQFTDDLLRVLLKEAQTEWQRQTNMTSDEWTTLVNEKFNGSESNCDAYLAARFRNKFTFMMSVLDSFPFMKT